MFTEVSTKPVRPGGSVYVRSTGGLVTPGGSAWRAALEAHRTHAERRLNGRQHRLKGCGVVPHPFRSLVARERLVLAVIRGRDQSTWAEEQQHTDSDQKQ